MEGEWKETGRYFHLSAPDHLRKVGEVAPKGFYPRVVQAGAGPPTIRVTPRCGRSAEPS